MTPVSEGRELCVIVQGPEGKGENMRATRLPVTVDPALGLCYALVKQVVMGQTEYLVIAQVPGAPEWRVVNARYDPVRRIGLELLRRNKITAPLQVLLGWDFIGRSMQVGHGREARRR